MKVFIAHIMRLSGVSRTGSQQVRKQLERAGSVTCLGSYGAQGAGPGWGFPHTGRGLCGLNILPGTKEGATGLPHHFAQMWGRREEGVMGAWNLSAVTSKWSQTLYYSKWMSFCVFLLCSCLGDTVILRLAFLCSQYLLCACLSPLPLL